MIFSVIIPTRNRPELLKLAINSVASQNFSDFEIIVMNDGSEEIYKEDYLEIEAEYRGKVNFYHLEQSCNGHGQSYAMNMGVSKAQGQYICFLDDDDFWIDVEHLQNAYDLLSISNADVYFSNQQCYYDGEPTGKKIWLAPLISHLQGQDSKKITTANSTAYEVNVPLLMQVDSFSHLNTTIIKAELYKSINGMDENIYYECDRDFYYRHIDQATKIIFNPVETSRHNIPIPKNASNMSTLVTSLDKMLFRIRLLDKAILYARHQELVKVAKLHKCYTLKVMCEALYAQQKYDLAAYYAKEVLLIGFTPKWAAYTLFMVFKSIF